MWRGPEGPSARLPNGSLTNKEEEAEDASAPSVAASVPRRNIADCHAGFCLAEGLMHSCGGARGGRGGAVSASVRIVATLMRV